MFENAKKLIEVLPRYDDGEVDTLVNNIDDINNPQHYTRGKIEVIDFIEDQKLNYHLANVIKYICRAPHKGTYVKDLKKAQWYLNRWIEISENIENSNDAEKRCE